MTRRALAAAAFGLFGAAVLIALGVWQLQRLEWKEGVIARLETRLAAEPAALPAEPDPAEDDFLRVSADGRLGERALHVLTSRRGQGPGYRVIAPLETAAGRRVLVDLGFLPDDMRTGGFPGSGTQARVTGALYWPDEVDGFTPEPDRAEETWFARDLVPMADALETEPVLVVAEAHDLGQWPMPLRLGIDVPNNHLGYALTWFSLALVWAVMSALLVRRERRLRA
ncbi:MAG TPA: SURF1 family protein [Thermohalobaculum sp.]|nr:SURF1 family protein [Thermohalobaculum sp.]